MNVFPSSRLLNMATLDGEPAAGGAVVTPPAVVAPVTGPDGEPFDPERAMSTINKLRAEIKELKPLAGQSQSAQAQIDALKKALGADPSTDPAALTQALEDQRKQTADAVSKYQKQALELALTKVAYDLGGNALLAPYLKGSGVLDDLDIESDSYQKDLTDRVKKILDKNPQLKAGGQVPPASGAPFPGGSGGDQDLITRDKISRMKPEEIDAARRAGKLTHLGIGAG